jgi:hypothetical protein
MADQSDNRIKTLERQVDELLKWKEAREKQQLTLPIDYASMKALDNAFREFKFNRINVVSVFFTSTSNIARTVKGQMTYYDDLTTQNFLCTTTTNPPNGTDFTGRINLTAV